MNKVGYGGGMVFDKPKVALGRLVRVGSIVGGMLITEHIKDPKTRMWVRAALMLCASEVQSMIWRERVDRERHWSRMHPPKESPPERAR